MSNRSTPSRHRRRNDNQSSSASMQPEVATDSLDTAIAGRDATNSRSSTDTTETLRKLVERLHTMCGDTPKMIATFHEEMMKTREAHEKQLENLRGRVVGSDLKMKIAEEVLNKDIRPRLKSDVAAQIRSEIAQQVHDRVPLTYKDQLERNKAELRRLRDALLNSEARLLNSRFEEEDQEEVLNKIINADGQSSKLWPETLNHLWSYNCMSLCFLLLSLTFYLTVHDSKQLLQDYGLQPDNELESNYNTFMMYIGIKFRLVAIDF
ncbi:hypothetical protein BDN72DRAFT_842529 [Pluteus cervinus]|uniref:Uncharacterized protein n=1 Tax=Pluteus cervinus TaxID=181527 RepID=A0ACD3ARA0_9AGAR|nr:hypothetical protein BDN72DRAFT_842529 [Pluteus cervinus]